jgi:type I restriction enzyme, R subunit
LYAQHQAKLYADCLEQRFGQRPVIFYSNGYDHWLWDDANYPPRPVQRFYNKAELQLLVQRRTTRKALAGAAVNDAIVERFYQTRAIRRIAETFEKEHQRKALVVMATGAGKTRTVIALCDLLMRCNWITVQACSAACPSQRRRSRAFAPPSDRYWYRCGRHQPE